MLQKLFKFDYYEHLFKFLYIAVILGSTSLTYMLLDEESKIRKNSQAKKEDMIFMSMCLIVVLIIKKMGMNLIHGKVKRDFICHKRYDNETLQEKRALTISKYIIDYFFYVFSSFYAFYVLKDTNYLSTWFFGKGECKNLFGNSFYETGYQFDQQLQTFYLVQLSIHAYAFLNHLIVNQYESKYYEYLLHHGCAFFLTFFSYYINEWQTGSVVMFLHDASDVILLQVRVYADYKNTNKKIVNFLFILNVLFWFYSRLLFLPFCVLYQCHLVSQQRFIQIAIQGISMWLSITILYAMLTVLAFMHLYWIFFMIKSALYYNGTNHKRYDVNQVEKQEDNIKQQKQAKIQ